MKRLKHGQVCGVAATFVLILPDGENRCEWVRFGKAVPKVGASVYYLGKVKGKGLVKAFQREIERG